MQVAWIFGPDEKSMLFGRVDCVRAFQKRADEMLALVAEKGGTAVELKQTKTRITE